MPLIDNQLPDGDKEFYIALTNASGPVSIAIPAEVPVAIIDDDIGIEFTQTNFTARESRRFATISVRASIGRAAIGRPDRGGDFTVRITGGTAVAGRDFVPLSI